MQRYTYLVTCLLSEYTLTPSKINGQLAPGIKLVSADDLQTWTMDIQVMDDNPIYKDQIYRLQFKFSDSYPIGIAPPSIPTTLLPLPRTDPVPQKHQKSTSSKAPTVPSQVCIACDTYH